MPEEKRIRVFSGYWPSANDEARITQECPNDEASFSVWQVCGSAVDGDFCICNFVRLFGARVEKQAASDGLWNVC